jgi:hypothetical protein
VDRSAGLKSILTGLLSFLLGIQFAVGAAAGRAACSRKPLPGLLLSAAGVLGMYVLLGLQGALMTAALAAALCAGSRLGLPAMATASVAAAAVSVAAALGLVAGPGLMGFAPDDIRQVLTGFYPPGLPDSVRSELVDLLAYLSPGAGAIQAVAGSAAAVAFFRAMGGQGIDGRRQDLRMGLASAWIVIVSLAVALWPGMGRGFAVQAAHNVLLFMTAPYFVAGAQVFGVLLRGGPAMVLLAVAAVLLAPPAAFAAVVLTGVLDTWFDFRKRLRARTEGNPL